jgi:hypothetical protein
MAIATKEEIKITPDNTASKTFKVAEQPTGQEYHYLHRVVGPQALPDGTLNGDMLDLEVMQWTQGKGYRIQAIHFLGQHKGPDNNVHGYVYGYHLVKG